MTIDLYQMSASAPCRTVHMTARQIGVKLNLIPLDLMKGEHLKPEFVALNPQHQIPTINDDGFILWESRAIQAYLVNKYAPDSSLYPKDPKKRAVVDRALYFDIGGIYKAMAAFVYPQLFEGKSADAEKDKELQKQLGILEAILEKTKYVAGSELTIADLSIFSELTFIEIIDYDFSSFPKIIEWMSLLKELPYHEEINEIPLVQMKQYLQSKK